MIGRYPQKATVWEFDDTLDEFGNRSFKAPRVIDVRWEVQNNLFLNTDGNEERSESTIYLKEDIPRGKIKLGEHTDSEPPNDASTIRDFRKIPSFRGDKFERRILLT